MSRPLVTAMRPTLCTSLILSLLCTSLSAQSVPKAVPLEEDERPVPKAIPVAPNETRMAEPARPRGPDEDLFDYASMSYDRSEWSIASQSYGQYLQNYPSGRHVPAALFRIGECYKNLNQLKVAETYWQEVVNRYPNSEGAPSAAYRLGAILFNARDFDQSARMFALCEIKSPLPQVRLAASFNKARAYQMLGETKRQIAALNTVIAVKTDKPEDNPYREAALLSLGVLLLAEDKKSEALPIFQELLLTAKDNATIAEASVNAAVLLIETGKPEEAIPLFEKALKIPETSNASRGIALVGVVQAMFAKGDYDGVINNYNANASILPEGETRPKMLLMVGNAFRMKKSYARAVETYLMVEQSSASSDAAFEAGYWKLYCFYLLDDKDLAEFATGFIAKHSEKRADHEFINLARLIRADHHFNKQRYTEAANSYADLQIDKLPAKLQPGTLFNKAWALAEAQRPQDAISAFSQFLTQFPAHELTAKALARRGLTYRDTKDTANAMSDFKKVAQDFPNSEATELAYLQMGLIAAEQRDHKATIAAFETLVKKFPTSPAAGQAWFGIGRAHYSLQQWAEAIKALTKTIDVDRKNYLDQASQMIIQAQYVQQNIEALSKAVDDFRRANPNANVPPNVLTWLGLKLYDQKSYPRAAQYLSLASTPDAPENTDPRVWNYLGMAFLETKDFETSVKATDHFLKVTADGAPKARALLTKGRALLGMKKFDEAEAVVQEGLAFAKDGKPQALLLILQGDILLALGDKLTAENQAAAATEKYSAAAGKFMIPAQFFDDDEITPEALDKAAKSLEKSGQADKAVEFRKLLKDKYPAYQGR
jgi:tetratricopeptide (TPR) repeat protein